MSGVTMAGGPSEWRQAAAHLLKAAKEAGVRLRFTFEPGKMTAMMVGTDNGETDEANDLDHELAEFKKSHAD